MILNSNKTFDIFYGLLVTDFIDSLEMPSPPTRTKCILFFIKLTSAGKYKPLQVN